jgi:hypothetical protein
VEQKQIPTPPPGRGRTNRHLVVLLLNDGSDWHQGARNMKAGEVTLRTERLHEVS